MRKPSNEILLVIREVFSDGNSRDVFRAEEIQDRLTQQGLRISRATIYRALRNLEKVGMVAKTPDETETGFLFRILQ